MTVGKNTSRLRSTECLTEPTELFTFSRLVWTPATRKSTILTAMGSIMIQQTSDWRRAQKTSEIEGRTKTTPAGLKGCVPISRQGGGGRKSGSMESSSTLAFSTPPKKPTQPTSVPPRNCMASLPEPHETRPILPLLRTTAMHNKRHRRERQRIEAFRFQCRAARQCFHYTGGRNQRVAQIWRDFAKAQRQAQKIAKP